MVCYAWKIMVCGEREDGRKNPALKTCIQLQGKDGIKQSRNCEHGSRRRRGPGGMDGGAVLEEAGFESGGEVTWWLLKN